MKKLNAAIAAIVIAVPALAAHAGSASTTFQVTANVLDNCTVSAGTLAFGDYSSGSTAAVDGSATINVTCSLLTAYAVGLGAGAASGATVTTRKMSSGANTLGYSLYSDALRVTNWGNSGTERVSNSGTGVAVSHMVYGRIPAGQTVQAGAYADTITVTISY